MTATSQSEADPTPPARRPPDAVRQVVVIAAFVFMIVGDAVGLGALGGTPIQDAQGGSFSPDASYLTPATGAFAIWTPIYLGLAVYTVWQALPAQRTSPRQRAMGWLVAVTMVCNGLWLVTVQLLSVWATVAVVVLLLAALVAAYLRSVRTRRPDAGVVDAVLIDGVTGLHLGWAALATVANLGAALTVTVPASWVAAADWLGVLVLAAVAAIGLAVSRAGGWRIAPVLAIGWGLAWLAVARLGGEPASIAIGTAAIAAAVVVVGVPLVARLRRGAA